MGFLDNLEDSLKSLESQEERDPSARQRSEEQRQQATASAPWAEKLKSSSYTETLLKATAVAGHKMRSKIYIAWLENVLRLEAKGRWCELRPTPNGIVCVFVGSDGQSIAQPVDLNGDPEDLLTRWLQS